MEINEGNPLFFATSSPRRKKILDMINLEFDFIEPIGDERTKMDQESVFDYVESLATVSYTHLTLPTTPYV